MQLTSGECALTSAEAGGPGALEPGRGGSGRDWGAVRSAGGRATWIRSGGSPWRPESPGFPSLDTSASSRGFREPPKCGARHPEGRDGGRAVAGPSPLRTRDGEKKRGLRARAEGLSRSWQRGKKRIWSDCSAGRVSLLCGSLGRFQSPLLEGGWELEWSCLSREVIKFLSSMWRWRNSNSVLGFTLLRKNVAKNVPSQFPNVTSSVCFLVRAKVLPFHL